MINYKKTYTESTSWRHWRLSCFITNYDIQLYTYTYEPVFKYFQNKKKRRLIVTQWMRQIMENFLHEICLHFSAWYKY